jgi:hypothetical protein
MRPCAGNLTSSSNLSEAVRGDAPIFACSPRQAVFDARERMVNGGKELTHCMRILALGGIDKLAGPATPNRPVTPPLSRLP